MTSSMLSKTDQKRREAFSYGSRMTRELVTKFGHGVLEEEKSIV